jgi:hypothetical protein
MQPRLRAVVTVAPVENGMLFRLEDQFLEIKGEHGWQWFQRIRPLLTGEVGLVRAREVLGEDHYGLFLRLVESLQRAGMVYDATGDRGQPLPDAMVDDHTGTLRRLEAHGASPRRTFAEMRGLRVIVAGEGTYVPALMEACREAGLTPCGMHVLTRGAGEGGSMVSVARAAWSMNVGALSQPAFRRMLASAAPDDVLLLGGDERLDAALSGTPADMGESRGGAAMFRLARYRDAAVAAVLAPGAGMGCAACLAAYYRTQDDGAGAAEPLAADVTRGIHIAARLLVQHLVDDRARVPPRASSYLSEVDLRTFDVRRRPVFPRLECRACGAAAAAPGSRDAPFETQAAAPREPRESWKRAEAFYVDRRTGLIAEISEGRLLQFPCHQSAAFRYPVSESRLPWITEAGDDIYEARVAVFHRAVETYLLERLPAARHDDLPPHAIVTSASTDDELRANAMLQAIARYAHEQSSDWFDVPISECETGAAPDLVLDYLRETGLLSQVRIQRNPSMSIETMEVVRFVRGAQVVSVAAGLEPARIWNTGLRDLWLDFTGVDAFGPAWEARRALRVRACGCPPAAVPAVEEALGRLSLELHVARVTSPVTAGVDPLLFAHAFLWSRHECRGTPVQVPRGHAYAAGRDS